MLDLVEIENTIQQLENGETTFDACMKLASLYTVRDRLYQSTESDSTEEELQDILPQYKVYKDIKMKYQLQEVTQDKVLSSLDLLCTEIKEFLHMLYNSTDLAEERAKLDDLYNNIRVGM